MSWGRTGRGFYAAAAVGYEDPAAPEPPLTFEEKLEKRLITINKNIEEIRKASNHWMRASQKNWSVSDIYGDDKDTDEYWLLSWLEQLEDVVSEAYDKRFKDYVSNLLHYSCSMGKPWALKQFLKDSSYNIEEVNNQGNKPQEIILNAKKDLWFFQRVFGKEKDYDECISILQRSSLPTRSNISLTTEPVHQSSQSKRGVSNKSFENRSDLTHTSRDEALRDEIDKQEQIRDSDIRSIVSLDSEGTVASSEFVSTNPEEIAEKLQSLIQRYLRGTEADVNISKKKKVIIKVIKIDLDIQPEATIKNKALHQTLKILLPENSYNVNGNVINIPWNILKDKHVRDFKKEFIAQENRLLRLELKATKAGQQNSPDVYAALTGLQTTMVGGFEASRKRDEEFRKQLVDDEICQSSDDEKSALPTARSM